VIPRERPEQRTSGEVGITVEREDWQARAACGRNGELGDDPAVRVRVMFPGTIVAKATEATSVCRRCPVVEECRELLERLPLRARTYGTWAGTGQRSRGKGYATCVECASRFVASGRRLTCSEACATARRRTINLRNQRAVRAGAIR
jgi:hypothetical protein